MGARVPGNLPADVTSFVGREQELARVRGLLSRGRVVTLTGPGGVGKTRLARTVAAQVHRAFPDGVWWIELAQLREADLVAVEIATRLGLEDDLRDPVGGLASYLRDRNLLLVLDNCEHLGEPVATLLSGLLTVAPGLRVLATSRHMLSIEGERLFEVPALSLPPDGAAEATEPGSSASEAVELFLDRAEAVAPELPRDAGFWQSVAELCRRLEGIPLAIELAAARLRAYPLEEILARVGHALDVLTTGPRSAPERHRALKTAIGWSFDLCTPDEQALWARLSVFAGGFGLDAAESVCSDDRLPRGTVFDLLAGLVDKSIIQRKAESARFSMLETVREYGLQRLAADGAEKEFRLRHARYFAALADRSDTDHFGDGEIGWFQELGANHANIRLAMQSCLFEFGEPRTALRIAARLRMCWASPGMILEGYQWLRKALAVSPEPSEERAEALWVCAYLELVMVDANSAAGTIAECRELADKLSSRRIEAALTLLPVHADFLLGDVAAALLHARQAIACGNAVGEPAITGEAMFNAAAMAFALGDADAERLAGEALTFLEGGKAQLWRANALWLNGLVRCRVGERDTAVACFIDAFAVFRLLGHHTGVAKCLDGLAWASALSGELPRAARLLGTARSIWEAGPSRIVQFQFGELFVEGEVEGIVRAGIGDAGFEAAYRSGTSCKPEDLVAGITAAKGTESEARPGAAKDPLGVLTRRERKVAELLAAGMSNRDIAADLVLSPRTVESHVQNILTKLGFHSRAQVASWISRLGSGTRSPRNI